MYVDFIAEVVALSPLKPLKTEKEAVACCR